MAEQLYTIPINEAFEEYDGCPLCRLRRKLEKQSLEYIMGAAMMEPDIRIVTNQLGFCREHFHTMLGMGSRLSLALMLESHLQYLWENTPEPDGKAPGRLGKIRKYDGESPGKEMTARAESCYVCARVRDFEKKCVSNVVYIYKKDPAFPDKLRAQPYFCLEHAGALLDAAKNELSEEKYLALSRDLLSKTRDHLAELKQNITAFCRSFDHRNAGNSMTPEARGAVDAAVQFLSGDFSDK